MANKLKVSAIQQPSPANTVMVQQQMKQSIETAQRLRGDPGDSYVRVSELTQGGLWNLVNGVLVPGAIASPSVSIVVADSITGSGTTASPAQLSGDSASPGNSMLYGTNGSGTKGWYAQGAGGSSTLAGLSDVSLSSPSNGQVLTYVTSASKWENQTPSGGGGSANITPDTHASSPTAWDDEFEYGATLDTSGARRSGANAWAVQNVLSSSNAIVSGALALSSSLGTGVNNNVVYTQSLTGVSSTWAFAMKHLSADTTTFCGIWLGFVTTGKGYYFGFYSGSIYILTATTYIGTSLAQPTGSVSFTLMNQVYFRVLFDATTLYFQTSYDGLVWATFYSAAPSVFLGGSPDSIGILMGFGSATTAVQGTSASVDWFRRTA